MSVRCIVVGDVHGCLDELDELLRVVQHRPGRDRLVLAGDMLDRGPDPVGVVRRARAIGAEAVLGNHEEKHLRYRRHEQRRTREPEYRNPMREMPEERLAQHLALSGDDWRWIGALPAWKRLPGGWLVVHAGFEPRRTLAEQKTPVIVRIRDVDERGKFVSTGDPRERPPGSVPWATRWSGPESVIYGHHVHGLAEPRVDRPREDVACWGIDTGCVFGGRLTALILPTCEVVQVPARREYVAIDREEID
ncbi:metallophosphoesterase [Sandaracinus amylolyticus]|uniref:Bis(5'-nucleosyl)-tetraphosphatase n=1 Tax=Sandaracinus amylolyticus TaxID=927083 RepID=A0A0F6W6N3_9BACT|nr:metallophosphoesterase [Sandaracinus amylolyticus]AKF08786.1 Bis(5'-nucleosyl)-tetraphosphatase [Sandaracinus amylolyticus]